MCRSYTPTCCYVLFYFFLHHDVRLYDFLWAYSRVLHGPGLGPRAGPARSPWTGPGFNDILRAGPGVGLKLAGPGRARAGK